MDINKKAAQIVFGVPKADVTPRHRALVKVCMLGIHYGVSNPSVEDLSESNAKRLVEAYKKLPHLKGD
jgi:DNA polymerase I-like protein with 3'-5' exonuclease and polymerase domains